MELQKPCPLLFLIPAFFSLGKRDHPGSCPSLSPISPRKALPAQFGQRCPIPGALGSLWHGNRSAALLLPGLTATAVPDVPRALQKP